MKDPSFVPNEEEKASEMYRVILEDASMNSERNKE